MIGTWLLILWGRYWLWFLHLGYLAIVWLIIVIFVFFFFRCSSTWHFFSLLFLWVFIFLFRILHAVSSFQQFQPISLTTSFFECLTDQTITHHKRSWCDPHVRYGVHKRWYISLTTGIWFRILGQWLKCDFSSCEVGIDCSFFIWDIWPIIEFS